MKQFYTYMMASARHGTLYIGMTSDLVKRVFQHKSHAVEGFTDKYDVVNLVWYEIHTTAENAIKREKALKRYKREWKIELIEEENPNWDDLYSKITR